MTLSRLEFFPGEGRSGSLHHYMEAFIDLPRRYYGRFGGILQVVAYIS